MAEEEKKEIHKVEFAEEIAWRTGLPVREARVVTDAVLDAIMDRFCAGYNLSFEGFGRLELSCTSERVGRNPKTGQEYVIHPFYKPMFRASKGLLERIRDCAQTGELPVPKRSPLWEGLDLPRRKGRPPKEVDAPKGYGPIDWEDGDAAPESVFRGKDESGEQ